VAAIMFMSSGAMKLFAFPVAGPSAEPVQLMSEMGIGGILEFFGGFLLLIGFVTRPIAFILAGEMAVAYFQFHFPNNPWPTLNQGTAAVLYCFIWLYFSVAGPGMWSVDAMIKGRKKHPKEKRDSTSIKIGHASRISPLGFKG